MVCVFARKTSEPLASLVKQIDRRSDENGKLKSFVVVMTKEPGKSPTNSKSWRKTPASSTSR